MNRLTWNRSSRVLSHRWEDGCLSRGIFLPWAWLSSAQALHPLSPESLACSLNRGKLWRVQESEGGVELRFSLSHQSWPWSCLFCFLGLSKGWTGRLERSRGEGGGSRLSTPSAWSCPLLPLFWTHPQAPRLFPIHVALFQHQFSETNSRKPIGCPTIEFSSDTKYLESRRPTG